MSRKRSPIPWLQIRNGVHHVCWWDKPTDKAPRRLSLGVPETESVEAQKRYAQFLTDGHRLFSDVGPASGLTVTQAADDYWREHVAEKVIDKERQETIIAHLKAYFKNDTISGVDIVASQGYRDARRAGTIGGGKRRKNGKASDSTIRRELVTLQAIANHAAKHRRIGPNATPATPMPSIELTSEIVGDAIDENDYLTQAELATALLEADGTLRDFMEIAYYTAGRRRSIERLTKFQVSLARNQIDLRRPDETVLQRKSKKRRPKVPIDPLMRPTIERLMAAGEAECEWLLGSDRDMYRPFRKLMESLKLGHKANPHILRHSRATHLLQSGVSIYDVAKLLGDTVATVEKVYGHHCPEFLADSIGRKSKAAP